VVTTAPEEVGGLPCLFEQRAESVLDGTSRR
jgi:hypothetical protein